MGFDSSELDEPWKATDLELEARLILDQIAQSKRPVVLAGGGIRLSGQHEEFLSLVQKLGIPVVTGWNAHDAVPSDHPLYVGRPGTVGDRGGNFSVQNSDLLLILGSRLNVRQVSYNWGSFAREAFKIWVDVDEYELRKPTVTADMPIHADLAELIPVLLKTTYSGPTEDQSQWLDWCKVRHNRYSTVLPEYWDSELINPYCFMEVLFDQLSEDQIVVSGNGTACVVSFQVAFLKRGQRLWTNSGCATMGYDLPAAIGACIASGRAPIVCLAGDGSIMMNLQELQTIVGQNLPIKIFILNNNGYASIAQTHRNFFGGVEVGGSPKSGVTFPDFEKVSRAFGLTYFKCESHNEMAISIQSTMATDGPVVCEVFLDEGVVFAPKLGAKQLPDGRIISPALEDLSPFLPKEEFLENMIIAPMEEE
jgi:acetolactate synthase-1/2/3 large subunit